MAEVIYFACGIFPPRLCHFLRCLPLLSRSDRSVSTGVEQQAPLYHCRRERGRRAKSVRIREQQSSVLCLISASLLAGLGTQHAISARDASQRLTKRRFSFEHITALLVGADERDTAVQIDATDPPSRDLIRGQIGRDSAARRRSRTARLGRFALFLSPARASSSRLEVPLIVADAQSCGRTAPGPSTLRAPRISRSRMAILKPEAERQRNFTDPR